VIKKDEDGKCGGWGSVGIVRRGLEINVIANMLGCCSVMLCRNPQAVVCTIVPVIVACSICCHSRLSAWQELLCSSVFSEARLSTGAQDFPSVFLLPVTFSL